MISHILFSIVGIKCIELGDGFTLADMLGREANAPFALEDGCQPISDTEFYGKFITAP